MAQLVLLGTGAALSDAVREHTYMVVKGEHESILIDCGGSPIQRLYRAGVMLKTIDHVIITHHHPDHMYGLSVFLLDLWLAGREKPLHLYGLAETLRAVRGMMRAFEWERWKEFSFFPVEFHTLSKKGIALSIVTPEFTVSTTPTQHLLPTVATRVKSSKSGKVMVYSSDTEMCDSVAEIARGANIFLHESTSLLKSDHGHSSAAQAGAQAKRASVKKLVLVHLPPEADVKKFQAAAKKEFAGPVVVGQDFQAFKF